MITWDSNVSSTSDFCSYVRIYVYALSRAPGIYRARVHVDQIVCSHAR